MEGRIKLQAVLAEIDQYEIGGALHTFSLTYVKKNGAVGHKANLRKSGGLVKPGSGNSGGTSNFKYNVKKNGVLMVVNHDTNEPLSLKIYGLTHYNGQRIQH